VTVKHRVTPLLELGAGFHPDLTGRENVILNGILLGLTRIEVLKKIPSIIEFSRDRRVYGYAGEDLLQRDVPQAGPSR